MTAKEGNEIRPMDVNKRMNTAEQLRAALGDTVLHGSDSDVQVLNCNTSATDLTYTTAQRYTPRLLFKLSEQWVGT